MTSAIIRASRSSDGAGSGAPNPSPMSAARPRVASCSGRSTRNHATMNPTAATGTVQKNTKSIESA
jgi:hypothetical protein